MKKVATILVVACLICFSGGLSMGQNDKGVRDKKGDDKKLDYKLPPELMAFQKQLANQPTEKLRQSLVVERAALEQWCKKNNFDPPGKDDRGKADNKGRDRGKTKSDRGKVAISKRQEAELLAQYIPWKAKIDLIEKELRAREKPKNDDRPKKDK